MNKFMILKILSRIVIYGCLAAFFFAFYLQDQMSDFLLRRTTVTSRIEQVSELDPPTLTICMDPPFKVSFAKKFNFSNAGGSLELDLDSKMVPNLDFEPGLYYTLKA